MKLSWVQTNFNAGEWSPLAWGRFDLQKYGNALSLCLNFIPTQQGGLTRRAGTRFVARAKHSTYAPRFQKFEFNTEQAYMLLFGHQYIRFFVDDGELLSGGVPYEVATTYTSDEIWELDFAQRADTLYIVHKNHPVRKLQRVAAATWTLTEVSLLDGPYLLLNISTTTLTPSAVTGTVTVTASSIVGVNGGAGFRATDVGRMLRIKCGSNWLWGVVAAFADTTHVTWTVYPASGVTYTAGATRDWRLGVWNATDGYPSCVAFHQGRLILAGSPSQPSRYDASNSADPENFAPSGPSGTVMDSNSFSDSLDADGLNAIQWLASDEWGLLAGTTGVEWAIAPSNSQTALTPTNKNQKPLTPYGSSRVAPVRVGKATLYVQRTKRKLRELFYHFTYNTFQAMDLTLLGEHLTKGGIKQMAVQLAPQQLVWTLLRNGKLSAMTYDKDQETVGWHQHVLGGYSDAAKTVGTLVDSIGVIPAPGVERDEVWLATKRYINGAEVRYIEVMTKMWEDGDAREDAVLLDASVEYRGTATTTVSGLTWAVGETVGVLTNGAAHPDRVVNVSGEITLQAEATVVQVGFRYTSAGRTLNPEVSGPNGPSQGRMKRVINTVFRFFQSMGIRLGSDAPGVGTVPMTFRTQSDPMDAPVQLFTGDKKWSYEARWDTEGRIYFETSDPTPCNITMLAANIDVSEG